jgi:hypothetical protein
MAREWIAVAVHERVDCEKAHVPRSVKWAEPSRLESTVRHSQCGLLVGLKCDLLRQHVVAER